jgi:hypothetical protein
MCRFECVSEFYRNYYKVEKSSPIHSNLYTETWKYKQKVWISSIHHMHHLSKFFSMLPNKEHLILLRLSNKTNWNSFQFYKLFLEKVFDPNISPKNSIIIKVKMMANNPTKMVKLLPHNLNYNWGIEHFKISIFCECFLWEIFRKEFLSVYWVEWGTW